MELIFDLVPALMGLFWLIFVVSVIARILKAVKKAASEQGKGFDQQTVLKRLEEMRRAMEAREASGAEVAGRPNAPVTPSQAPAQPQTRAGYPQTYGKPAELPRRSRFEDPAAPTTAAHTLEEGESASEEYSESRSGSLEGTSSESLKESLEKDKYGNLTPFQKELEASKGLQLESQEGRASEEAGIWKNDEMCDAWGESTEGDIETELARLSGIGEPEHVDLIGGIDMNEMADAIVWSEIMGRPIALRPSGYNAVRRR